MKNFKIVQALMVAFLLHVTLSGTAAAENMQKNMGMEKKMQAPKMMDSQMKDSMQRSDTMKTDTMKTDSMSAPVTAMLTGSKGHHAVGKVTFGQEMGKDRLLLTDIKVDKVPDGHVYLAKKGNRAKGIDLGVLKQFSGTVAFALPAGTDPAAYDSVIIYCKKYNVEIGRATFKTQM